MVDTYKGIWIQAYKKYCYFAEFPAFYFRKSFNAPAEVKEAKIQLCGLGIHELYVNGVKADDRWFAPGLSQFDYRVGSITYDVKHLIEPGKENVIMIQLGNGFFNCRNGWMYTVNFSSWRASPRLICDCFINGEIVMCSGVDWKIHSGPITFDCHHQGEDYDARLELPEEAFKAGYDDSEWDQAFRVRPPGGILEHDTDEPNRIIAVYPGKKLASPAAGYTVFDFGVNFSGIAEIKMQGKRGTKVTFRYGEKLTDGKVDTSDLDLSKGRFETDSYIFKGDGVEVWHPHFVWHGFQYLEAVCEDPEVQIIEANGWFISSDLKKSGSIECSDPVMTRLQELTMTSYRSNFMSIPTDCPTREKFGWTGDADIAMETGWWNFKPQNGLRRLLDICVDIQRPDGNFTTHGPTTLWGFEQSCPTYSIYLYDFCRYCYEFDGNDEMIRKYYDSLHKGMKFFEVFTSDDNLCHEGYADWCNPEYHPGKPGGPALDPTAIESIAWYGMIKNMIVFANLLGKNEDLAHYNAMAEKVRNAIRNEFFNAGNATFDNGFASSTAMALVFGIFNDDEKAAVAENLVKTIRSRKHQVWFGIQGAKNIPRALAENGYADDAYKMFVQDEFPGWGNLIKQGATSLWENWAGIASRNHIMFGDTSAWMYRYLCGISPLSPGFKTVGFAPCFVTAINNAKAEYATPFGKIVSAWERKDGKIYCRFEIPAGTTAVVKLPGIDTTIDRTTEFVIG